MKRIKTLCRADKGGCGKEFFLDVTHEMESEDEWARKISLQLAALVGCPSCSVYQRNLFLLEDVRDENQKIIWEHQRSKDYLEKKLTLQPNKSSEIGSRILEIENILTTARQDLAEALRELSRLCAARNEQLEALDFSE